MHLSGGRCSRGRHLGEILEIKWCSGCECCRRDKIKLHLVNGATDKERFQSCICNKSTFSISKYAALERGAVEFEGV